MILQLGVLGSSGNGVAHVSRPACSAQNANRSASAVRQSSPVAFACAVNSADGGRHAESRRASWTSLAFRSGSHRPAADCEIAAAVAPVSTGFRQWCRPSCSSARRP
jgi:hypothetical protein